MKKKICARCKISKSISEFGKGKRNRDGLFSYCKLCKSEYMREYRQSERGRKSSRKACLKYYYSDKGQETLLNYKKSGRQKESFKQFRKSEKGIALRRKLAKSEKRKIYLKSDKCKELYREKKARRKNMGYIPLWDNPFPEEIDVDWHHINNFGLVIPVPRMPHNKCNHIDIVIHRKLMEEVIKKIYYLDINKLISDII